MESPQLQWFWASSSSWTRSLCPFVQRLGARNAWFECGYLLRFTRVAYGRICTIFYVKGWTRILRSILVASLPVHMPKMKWPRSSSTTSVACFLAGIAGFLHLALCSRRCRHDGMHTVRSVHSRCFSYLSCTWKSVHYFYDPCVFSAFFRSRNFALVDFLGPSSTHSCECSRAGGAGVAGSLLPGDSAPGSCQSATRVSLT